MPRNIASRPVCFSLACISAPCKARKLCQHGELVTASLVLQVHESLVLDDCAVEGTLMAWRQCSCVIIMHTALRRRYNTLNHTAPPQKHLLPPGPQPQRLLCP